MIDTGTRDGTARPGRKGFWVGLLFMLGFAAAGFGGAYWAYGRISLERALYSRGAVASGVVVEKIVQGDRANPNRTTYAIRYRFDGDAGPVTGQARVERDLYFSLRQGDTVGIRYLPDDPGRNLPDGTHMSDLMWLAGGLGLIVGAGASVVVVGMTVTRVRGS